MKQRENIFKKAWEITTDDQNSRLFWFGFIPAFFTTLLSSISYSFKGYQYWTEFVAGGNVRDGISSFINSLFQFFLENPGYGLLMILLGIIFFMCYYFLPIIFHGGLIKILPKVLQKEPIKFRMGLVYGGRYFFKMFEFKALMSPFRLTWVFLTYSILKIFAPELLLPLAIPLFVWFVVNVCANFLFIFVEYFIVHKDMMVLESLRASMKMVFLNIEDVALMIVLILLMELRMILNVIFILGIPLLLFFGLSFLSSTLLFNIGASVALLLGILLFLFISYLNAHITVFITSAWMLTFLYFGKEIETIETSL